MDIILLHGWGKGAESFKDVAQVLSHKGFRAHLFDFPGFGKAPRPLLAWGVGEYADFVEKYAAQHGLGRFFILGHSFGGRVAIKLAVRSPEKIQGLILYSSAGIRSKEQAKNKIFLVGAKIGKKIFSLPGLGALTDFARQILYKLAGSKDYYLAEGIMKEVMQKVIAEDLEPTLNKISASTLIVWGTHDKVVPIRQGMIMKEKIRGAEFISVEGRGHNWHKNEPEKFVEVIMPFLEKHKIL